MRKSNGMLCLNHDEWGGLERFEPMGFDYPEAVLVCRVAQPSEEFVLSQIVKMSRRIVAGVGAQNVLPILLGLPNDGSGLLCWNRGDRERFNRAGTPDWPIHPLVTPAPGNKGQDAQSKGRKSKPHVVLDG